MNVIHIIGNAALVGAQKRADFQVLRHGHIRKDAAPLRHVDDAPAHDFLGGQADQLLAAVENGAALRLLQAGYRAQCGRFARAVRADQRHNLPFIDGQINALERADAAVGNVQILDFKLHRRHLPDRRGSRRRFAESPPVCPRRSARRSSARKCGRKYPSPRPCDAR